MKTIQNKLISIANNVFAANYYIIQSFVQLDKKNAPMTLNEVLKYLPELICPEGMDEQITINEGTFTCSFPYYRIFDILKSFCSVESLPKNFVFENPNKIEKIEVGNIKAYAGSNDSFKYETENIYIDYKNGFKVATNGVILKAECIVKEEKQNIFVTTFGIIAENQSEKQHTINYKRLLQTKGVFFNFDYKFLRCAKHSVKIEILETKIIIHIEGVKKEYQILNKNTAIFEISKKQIEAIRKEKVNEFYLCEKQLLHINNNIILLMFANIISINTENQINIVYPTISQIETPVKVVEVVETIETPVKVVETIETVFLPIERETKQRFLPSMQPIRFEPAAKVPKRNLYLAACWLVLCIIIGSFIEGNESKVNSAPLKVYDVETVETVETVKQVDQEQTINVQKVQKVNKVTKQTKKVHKVEKKVKTTENTQNTESQVITIECNLQATPPIILNVCINTQNYINT